MMVAENRTKDAEMGACDEHSTCKLITFLGTSTREAYVRNMLFSAHIFPVTERWTRGPREVEKSN
jgi:hypothetical protein